MTRRKTILALVLIVVATLVTITAVFLGQGYRLQSMTSHLMIPAIYSGDLVLIKKGVEVDDLRRGDIVSFIAPYEGRQRRFLRRLVGFPNDKFTSNDTKKVQINGLTILVRSLSASVRRQLKHKRELKVEATVPENKYCVSSDNSYRNDKRQRVNEFKKISELEGKYICTVTTLFRFEPVAF